MAENNNNNKTEDVKVGLRGRHLEHDWQGHEAEPTTIAKAKVEVKAKAMPVVEDVMAPFEAVTLEGFSQPAPADLAHRQSIEQELRSKATPLPEDVAIQVTVFRNGYSTVQFGAFEAGSAGAVRKAADTIAEFLEEVAQIRAEADQKIAQLLSR